MVKKSILFLSSLGISTSLLAITPDLQKKVDEFYSQKRAVIEKSELKESMKEDLLQQLEGEKIRVETLDDDEITHFLETGELPKNDEMADSEENSWVGWVFGATDVAIDVFTTKGLSSGLTTITGSFGPRYNFSKMAPATIFTDGFSIAARLGLGVAALDNFHETGFALPIELEASYTTGHFTTSAGLSFLIIPTLKKLENLTNAGVYLDLGWANPVGAMTFRLGYIFHSSATLNLINGQSINYDPLNGSFNFGVRWQM